MTGTKEPLHAKDTLCMPIVGEWGKGWREGGMFCGLDEGMGDCGSSEGVSGRSGGSEGQGF